MAGPVASVLLPQSLAQDRIEEIRHWLSTQMEPVSGELTSGAVPSWDFWICLPEARSAVNPPDFPSPIAVSIENFDDIRPGEGVAFWSELEFEDLVSELGWEPKAEITVSSMCNRDRDHHVLAWLTIELAERLGGVIDTGGELNLPADLREAALASRALIALPYASSSGHQCSSDIVTSAFLHEWRKQREFRMVK